MKPRTILVIVCLALPLLVGCKAPGLRMQVSGLAADRGLERGSTYTMIPVEGGPIREYDLEYREYADYVALALEDLGYRPAPTASEAQVLVTVDFGVTEPLETIETVTEPRSGFGVGTSYGGHRSGTYGHYDWGYRTTTRRYLTFGRILRLTAIDNENAPERGDAPPNILWSVRITSEGNSNDLRWVLPYMVAGTHHHWGTDTGRALTHRILLDDPRVRALRNGNRNWANVDGVKQAHDGH